MGGFGGCCGYGWFGNLGGFGWIGLLLYLLVLIICVIGIVAFIFFLVRRLSGNDPGASHPTTGEYAQTSPQEVLAIRFARGEIDREEFKKLISDLN